MVLWLWLGLAFAQDEAAPVCGDLAVQEPPEALSVAWVSPLRERASRGEWVPVVPTGDLRRFVADEAGGNLGRLLQRLGLRKRPTAPSRRYKVTIFDVRSRDLCRPITGFDDPAAIEGVVTCARARLSRPRKRTAGCGRTLDQATEGPGEELYYVRWDDAARNGFCVLPAERFVTATGS